MDPADDLVECNEENNTTNMAIHVYPAPRPDLVVQSEWIELSHVNPELGDTLCVQNTDIYNVGLGTAYGVEVVFTLAGDTLGEIVTIDSIPNYGANNYRPTQPTECAVVDTCDPPIRILEVCVDPFAGIVELNELNNCATKAILYCDPECCNLRGDINHNGSGPDIADLVYLVNYMFNGGPAPVCQDLDESYPEADVDGSGNGPDIADLVYLVNYMFNGGPAPVPCP